MKKTYIVVASSIMILFCLAYQSAYAYFSTVSQIEQDFNTSISSTTINDLVISDGAHVTSSNLIPGDSVTNNFTVQNPNNLNTCFNLIWTDVNNTFVNQNDLVINLKDQTGKVIVNEASFPSQNNTVLSSNLSIGPSTTLTYTLTVTYKNTDSNQIEDIGKTFSANIQGVLTTCS